MHGVGSLAVKKTRKKLSESRVDATGGKKVEKRAVRRGFGDSDSSEEEEEQEEAPEVLGGVHLLEPELG